MREAFDLADTDFGPGLMTLLAVLSQDPAELTETALVEAVGLMAGSRAWVDGQTARLVAELASRHGGPTDEDAAMTDAIEAVEPGREPRPWFWEKQVLGARLAISSWEARRLVATSVALCGGRLGDTLDALMHGGISWAHADALAGKTVRLSDEQAAEVEQALLADKRAVTARQWAVRAEAHARRLAPVEPRVRTRSASARELLDGGVEVHAVLDAEGGRIVARAVETYATPTGSDDDRTVDERWADALVEISRIALDHATGRAAGAARPHLNLFADARTFADGSGPVQLGPAGDLGPVEISADAARRLTCEAGISRVSHDCGVIVGVDDSDKRMPGRKLRREIALRDGGCRFPGCTRPIGRCHPHHVQFWAQDGPSTAENLLSLCEEHHRTVHDDGWQLTFDGRTAIFTDPTGHVYEAPPPLVTPPRWVDPPFLEPSWMPVPREDAEVSVSQEMNAEVPVPPGMSAFADLPPF